MATISHLPLRDDDYAGNGYAHNYMATTVDNLIDLAEIIRERVWSPIVWREGRRLKDNFAKSDLWVFDFDEGRTLHDVEQWLQQRKLAHIIGLTKSHQMPKVSGKSVKPPCDRFRVIVPMHEPITDLETFEYNMTGAIKTLGCDESCKDGARFYFPCTRIHAMAPGQPVRWKPRSLSLPSRGELAQRAVEKSNFDATYRRIPRHLQNMLACGVASGGRHKACYRLGANLIHYGFSDDQILSMVLSSPLAEIGEKDVGRAVANGIARARRELARGTTGGGKA